MPELFAIGSADEVKRLLEIAKRHLGYIERSHAKRTIIPGDLKPDHGIVASIFSAAAVEIGLNLFLSIPILLIKDGNLRKFFAVLLTKYLRLSVPQKIEFVCEFCPQIRQNKALLKRVRALFEYRNSVLHSSPEYSEPLGPPNLDFVELSSTISEEDFVRHPQLVSRGTSTLETEEAFRHYQTALDFLDKLTVLGQDSKA